MKHQDRALTFSKIVGMKILQPQCPQKDGGERVGEEINLACLAISRVIKKLYNPFVPPDSVNTRELLDEYLFTAIQDIENTLREMEEKEPDWNSIDPMDSRMLKNQYDRTFDAFNILLEAVEALIAYIEKQEQSMKPQEPTREDMPGEPRVSPEETGEFPGVKEYNLEEIICMSNKANKMLLLASGECRDIMGSLF